MKTSYYHYGLTVIDSGNEYAVAFSQSELDIAVREYIRETAWAFNSDFLSYHCDLEIDVIKMLQKECESCNNVILRLIKDFDYFVSDAVSNDGYGLYLASYDGEHITLQPSDISNLSGYDDLEILEYLKKYYSSIITDEIHIFRLN